MFISRWQYSYENVTFDIEKRLAMTKTSILPLIVLILSLILPATVKAQVPVTVSNEKTVSGGKVYYMHEVKKGQTLYSISRAYKVKIVDITGENVIPSSGIQTGQVLRIPAGEQADATATGTSVPAGTDQAVPMPKPRLASNPPGGAPSMNIEISDQKIVSNNKEYYMHQVLKGQTLYSIAKAYKVTILDIDRENVIPASGIQAGQILRIPASSSLTVEKENTLQPPENTPATTPAPTRSATANQADTRSQVPHQENASAQTQLPHPDNAATQAQMPHQESAATNQQMPHQEKPSENPAEAEVTEQNVAQNTRNETPPVKEETTEMQAGQQEATPAGETVKQDEPEQDSYKRIVHKVRKGESLSEIADKYGVTVQDIRKTNKGVIFAMPDMRLVILVKEEPDSN